MTEYILRSQSGRDVLTCTDENRARQRQIEMAQRGVRLRLFRVTRREKELAA